MTLPAVARPDADARAGRRLLAAALGLLGLGLLVGPLALLVHDRWSPLLDLDTSVTRSAERLAEAAPWVADGASVLSHLGDPLEVTIASVVGALLLWRRGHRRLAVLLLLSRAGAALLSTSLKLAVDRARPVFEEPVYSAFGASFPSGHALAASAGWAAFAVVALTLRPRLRRPALLVAVVVPLVVAATRVLLGVHYLSDVAAGLVLGWGWTAVCVLLLAVWSREEGHPVDVSEEGLGSRA